jgi:hypothetical protein
VVRILPLCGMVGTLIGYVPPFLFQDKVSHVLYINTFIGVVYAIRGI